MRSNSRLLSTHKKKKKKKKKKLPCVIFIYRSFATGVSELKIFDFSGEAFKGKAL